MLLPDVERARRFCLGLTHSGVNERGSLSESLKSLEGAVDGVQGGGRTIMFSSETKSGRSDGGLWGGGH